MKEELNFQIKSIAELKFVCSELVGWAQGINIFLFTGDLGSGKTSFIKELARKLNIKDSVSSPSFSIINVYTNQKETFYHFDLYRIKTIEELEEIGGFEYLFSGNYCFIEWPELLVPYLDLPYVEIKIEIGKNNERNILFLKN